MSKMKKMFAVIAAATMLCSSMAAMNVGAVNYNVRYDINRDNSVDIMDVMALNQYLMGVYYVDDISRMDVNQNLIVDTVDSQMLLAYTIDLPFQFTYLDVTAS